MNISVKRLAAVTKAKYSRGQLIAVVAGIGVLGVIAVVTTHATTSTASVEAESGTVSSSACKTTDSTASASSAVKFGDCSTNSSDPLASLARIPWDGGAAYYSKFPAAVTAGWTSTSHFPIAVFLGGMSDTSNWKNVGVNTYEGVSGSLSTQTAATAAASGISLIPNIDSWSASNVAGATNVPGWFTYDECDQGEDAPCAGATDSAKLSAMTTETNKLRATNDGRFVMANFAKGSVGMGGTVSSATFQSLINLQDVVTDDQYVYSNDNELDWLQGKQQAVGNVPAAPGWPTPYSNGRTSAGYGFLTANLGKWQTTTHMIPHSMFVDTATGQSVDTTGNQIVGAQMSNLINESRFLAYFPQWVGIQGNCESYFFNCTDRATIISNFNHQVLSLAPVLNTQSYVYNFGATGIQTMLKSYNGSAYVFADVGVAGTTGSKTFTLPAGVSGTSVTVVGENRTLPVTNGKFTDTFSNEYSYHIYQVTL